MVPATNMAQKVIAVVISDLQLLIFYLLIITTAVWAMSAITAVKEITAAIIIPIMITAILTAGMKAFFRFRNALGE